MNLPPTPAWMAEAVCASIGGDLFFPEQGGSTRPATRVCNSCPVQQQCLDWALGFEAAGVPMDGIYGGVSKRRRVPMVRARRAAA